MTTGDGIPQPERSAPRLVRQLRSPRTLMFLAGGLVLVVLLRVFTGSSSRDEQALFASHDLILVATQSVSSSNVDLHVMVDGEEPDRENRVLRGVTLDAILPVLPGLGDGLASFDLLALVGESIALVPPVRDGFLVHARTSNSAEVWFVGAGGEENAVQLFASNRTLSVSYAPRTDVLLVREESEDDFRCYRGSSSSPAERIGRGDGCWLGADGAIAIARRESDDLKLVYLAPDSDQETERILRNVVAPSGSLNVRDLGTFDIGSDGIAAAQALVLMGLWGSEGEFSYLESSGRLASIVRIALPSGDEVYRSPTWAAEDFPLLVFDSRGPRVAGNLEEQLPEVLLTSGGTDGREIARARTAIEAHPLVDGRIIFSRIDRYDSGGETRVDVAVWDGSGDTQGARTLVEDVAAWFPLESSAFDADGQKVESLLALREDGEVLLVDVKGSSAPRAIGIDDADLLLSATTLPGDDGRLTIVTESRRGLNIDVWDGEKTLRLVDGWLKVTGLIPTDQGYLVVGSEVAGDSEGIFLLQPGVAAMDRLFRAPSIVELFPTRDPDVFYVNAVDQSDAVVRTLHRLDISEKARTDLGRGRFVVQTGFDRGAGFGVSAAAPQGARTVMLFDECKDSYAGRLEADSLVEIALDGGSMACWLWESAPGGDDDLTFVWLHANEFSGTVEVATDSGFSIASLSTGGMPYQNPIRRPELPTSLQGTPLFVLVRSTWDAGNVQTAILQSGTGGEGLAEAFMTITAPLHDESCDEIDLSYEQRAECLAGGIAVVNDAGIDSRSLRYRSGEATIARLTTRAFRSQAAEFRIDLFDLELCQPDPRRIDRHLCYFVADSGDPNRRPTIMLSATVGFDADFYAAEFFLMDSRGFRVFR